MKKKLTDDQAEMLEFLANKGTFEQSDLFGFFSHFELWDNEYKVKIFQDLNDLNLLSAERFEDIFPEDKTILDKDFSFERRVYGMHVTDDAKALLTNYLLDKKDIAEKKALERQLLKGNVLSNKLTWTNIGVTILISVIVLAIQIRSCNRDEKRDLRELRKEETDSLQAAQTLRHDSLYEKYLLRKVREDGVFSKNDTSSKK